MGGAGGGSEGPPNVASPPGEGRHTSPWPSLWLHPGETPAGENKPGERATG